MEGTTRPARTHVMYAVRGAARRSGQRQPFGNPYHQMWANYPRPEKSAWGIYEATRRRDHAVKVFAWGIPDDAAIDAICAVSPCGVVEIGAGTGYWARLLGERGIPGGVTAFDLQLGGAPEMTWWPIYVGGPERAADHPERTLLLCWPPYGDPMAADALTAYHAAGGETVVYVGEGEGGCTGDDRFHRLLGETVWCSECEHLGWCQGPDDDCIHPEAHGHDPKLDCAEEPLFKLATVLPVPQWEGIHDRLYIYHRRRAAALSAPLALPPGDPTP